MTRSEQIPPRDILSFLSRGAWFGSLDPQLRAEIVDRGQVRRCARGETLVVEDTPGQAFYCVLQGQVSVSRLSGDGDEFLIHIGGPGFWFGELALLAASPAAVTIATRRDTTVFVLKKAAYERIVEHHTDLTKGLAALVAQRQIVTLRNLAQSLTLPPEEYLRVRLADLVQNWRHDGLQDEVVDIAISQSDLARMLGIARQSVNRFLQRLEAEGLVEVSFRSIRITDVEKLLGARRQSGLEARRDPV